MVLERESNGARARVATRPPQAGGTLQGVFRLNVPWGGTLARLPPRVPWVFFRGTLEGEIKFEILASLRTGRLRSKITRANWRC
jgi:hypothetical protein